MKYPHNLPIFRWLLGGLSNKSQVSFFTPVVSGLDLLIPLTSTKRDITYPPVIFTWQWEIPEENTAVFSETHRTAPEVFVASAPRGCSDGEDFEAGSPKTQRKTFFLEVFEERSPDWSTGFLKTELGMGQATYEITV